MSGGQRPADRLEALARAFDLSEADVNDTAEKLAGQVRDRAELWQINGLSDADSTRALQQMARRHYVEPPERATLPQLLNRLTARAWWRRALRKRYRFAELHEIARGAVSDHASPYVSAKALRRHRCARQRNADLLASLEALNLDSGEVIPLDELAAKSQANPAMRRKATMARIRGLERDATAKGECAAMLAITAPSRMHARHTGGRKNDKHDGTSPRQAQAYLNRVWRLATREIQRSGLQIRGLRTVEPHHDACPHWHVLVFAPQDHMAPALEILRTHALADSPDEPGAAEHRFDVEHIDTAKGCATAYVAKYVSKSIDGHALDGDTESSEDGPSAAERVVAWAREWGIRQFQFFGTPPITPMRELYRVTGTGLGSQAIDKAHQACREKDHAGYLQALEAHGLRLSVAYVERPSRRYVGEVTHAIHGLTASGADLAAPQVITTRTSTWCIQPKPVSAQSAASAPPWTRFNNCAGLEKSTAYKRGTFSAAATRGQVQREARRRRPPATAGPQFAAF